jgi:hypothetical protein
MSAVRSVYRKTARNVENIRSANVDNVVMTGRQITGNILITSEQGEKMSIEV